MGRKHGTMNEMLAFIIVLIVAIAFLWTFIGGVVDALFSGWDHELAALDGERVSNAILAQKGVGSVQTIIELNQEYDSIRVSGGNVIIDAGFLDDPVENGIDPRFRYSGTATGKTVCITKEGWSYQLTDAPCPRTNCAKDTCSVYTDGSRMVTGYWCRNGTYTRENIYTHYYNSSGPACDPQPDRFGEINKLACPGQLTFTDGYSDQFTCEFTVTWRCDAGNAVIQFTSPDDADVFSRSCSGELRHETFSFTSELDDAETISARLTVPGAGSNSVSKTIDVFKLPDIGPSGP